MMTKTLKRIQSPYLMIPLGFVFSSMLLTSCSQTPKTHTQNHEKTLVEHSPQVSTPVSKSPSHVKVKALDGEMFYHLFMADIAKSRHQNAVAAQHLLRLAQGHDDINAAKESWQLAVLGNQVKAEFDAASLWYELSLNQSSKHPTLSNNSQQAALAKLVAQLKMDNTDNIEDLFSSVSALKNPRYPEIAAIAVQKTNTDTQDLSDLIFSLIDRAAVNTNPQKSSRLIALAIYAGINNDAQKTIDLLQQGLALAPNEDGYLLLASLQPKNTQDILQQGHKALPHSNKIAQELLSFLRAQNNTKASITLAQDMTTLQPNNVAWLEELAALHYQAGQLNQAIDTLYQLRQQNSLPAKRALQIGILYSELENYDIALQWLQQAHHHSVFLQMLQQTLRIHIIQQKESADFFTEQLALYPDKQVDIDILHANWFVENNDRAAAISLLNNTLKQFPANEKLPFELSMLHEQGGNITKAIEILETALASNENNADVQNGLGYLLLIHKNDLVRAEPHIIKANQLDTNNAAYQDSLAWLYYLKGDLKNARKWLEIAVKAQEHPEIIGHLVEVYNALGLTERANNLLNYGVSKFPEDTYLQTLIK